MKLKDLSKDDLFTIQSCDILLRTVIKLLRGCKAKKAADAVARARKSVGGAIRHAQRIISKKEDNDTRST